MYRAPLFDPTLLQTERLLPTEYLFFYDFPAAALENVRRAGRTRGQAVAQLNDRFFGDLAVAGADRRRVYREYLESRNAGYLQIESGSAQPVPRSAWAELTGYDKIALSVVRAIHLHTNAIIPLNVLNRGALRDLEDDDVVEVPCVVNANGARPMNVGRIPDHARDLIVRVKEYERLTIEAALAKNEAAAARALTRNPLVGDPRLARDLVDAVQPLW